MVRAINRMFRRNPGGLIFDTANTIFMLVCIVLSIYPLMYVALGSLSDSTLLTEYRGILLKPLGFSLNAYKLVFRNSDILMGYKNTLIYMTVGTVINLLLTTFGAYALSRRNVLFKNVFMILILITMYFDGGLVPLYLLIKGLHMYNTMWALILPGAVGTMYLIIMKTSFQSVPDSLEESARIDGANDFTILFKIMIPLSLPVIAVMVLFYAVGQWNGYFYAMVFLRDTDKYPLQLILRQILITTDLSNIMTRFSQEKIGVILSIKYAVIVLATVPILCVYPFLQKYFVKGVMIGALK